MEKRQIYRLGLHRQFSARHYLIGGDWGDENREHSHRYGLELVVERADLDRHGFVVDIVDVAGHLDAVVAEFTDKTLNDLPDFAGHNPSIERLATIVHGLMSRRLAACNLEALTVTVREDDIAWTSYHATL